MFFKVTCFITSKVFKAFLKLHVAGKKPHHSLSSTVVWQALADRGELRLRSVPEVAVNSTNPLQGSSISMSSVEIRLEAFTIIRFTTPCYLIQYYRIPGDC